MAITKSELDTIANYVDFMLDRQFAENSIGAGIVDICNATEKLLSITEISDQKNIADQVIMRVAKMRGYIK